MNLPFGQFRLKPEKAYRQTVDDRLVLNTFKVLFWQENLLQNFPAFIARP